MEETIISLLGGELGVTTILLLFILGLLTKRFVPWWVYEALVEELKVYKNEAPELIREVQRLLALVEEEDKRDDHEDQGARFRNHDGGVHRDSRTKERSNTRRRERHYE